MTQEEPPLWRQILHHNDSLFVIVTLTGLISSPLIILTFSWSVTNQDQQTVPDNAGADWNNMPRTNIEDPKVKREFQLLRLRGVLDSKKHFKKDNRKDAFPQYSQMGTLIEGPTEYYSARVARKDRKQTLVEEVLASEANSKYKGRYDKIQEKKMSGKKGHYKKMMARRKRG